jgi:hypothetical protein
MNEIEARIAAAADQVDRLREQFPDVPAVEFRQKAYRVLVLFGTDRDIANIAIQEADIR